MAEAHWWDDYDLQEARAAGKRLEAENERLREAASRALQHIQHEHTCHGPACAAIAELRAALRGQPEQEDEL
ncbi:MAG: hypothetical protein ACOC7S_00970 [Planctomycetota bacterium]